VRTLKNSGVFLEPYCSWWGKATKKKTPETTNNRPARGSSGGSTRLLAQGSSGGAACHRGSGSHLPAALGPARVPWTPAPASRRRAAPGAPRVPAAPGRMKIVELSSSKNRAPDDFFSTRLPAQGSSGAPCVPTAPGQMKTVEPIAEDLAEPGRCKATPIRSKRNRAQGAVADSYRIDPDPRW
jgi:hypothetical protein